MTETSPPPVRRIRITDFYAAKRQHERWAMLTSYDQYTAELFDEAGVWALLVGDSAANNVYGYETTLPITVAELLPLVRAVVKSTKHAFVIADLPLRGWAVAGLEDCHPLHEGRRLSGGEVRGRGTRC